MSETQKEYPSNPEAISAIIERVVCRLDTLQRIQQEDIHKINCSNCGTPARIIGIQQGFCVVSVCNCMEE